MLGNPFIIGGVTRQPAPLIGDGPSCSLGVAGEFPSYTPGLSYTGTVDITGASGATTVELISAGGGEDGTVYVPIQNAGFEALTGWARDTARTPEVSPGFSIQSGTGRNGTGFLRWQGNPDGKTDKFNSLTVARTAGGGRTINAKTWVRCTAHSGGGGVVQAAIKIEQFADEACTIPLNETVSEFANFSAVDTSWRDVRSWAPDFNGYCRVSLIVTQGIALAGFSATLEFDDVEWDARQTIDTWSTGIAPTGIPLQNGNFESGNVGWAFVPIETNAGLTVSNASSKIEIIKDTGNGRNSSDWVAKFTTTGGNIRTSLANNVVVYNSSGNTVTITCLVKLNSLVNDGNVFAGLFCEGFSDAALTNRLGVGTTLTVFTEIDLGSTWRRLECTVSGVAYIRLSLYAAGTEACEVYFDDVKWDADGVAIGGGTLPSAVNFPAGFTIDTITTPDRVRVQWPGIPVPGNSSLLLNMNGTNGSTTFVDSSTYNHTTTAYGNAQISTAQSKFGGASGYFNGGDYVQIPGSSAFDISTGDWTVRGWVRFPNTPASALQSYAMSSLKTVDNNLGTTFAIIFGYSGLDNTLALSVFEGGTAYSTSANSIPVVANTWHHVAVARQGNTFRVYFDGVQVANTTQALTLNFDPTWPLRVGRSALGTGGNDFRGYIDDFEFIKGTCLYPNGTTFTPPTTQAIPSVIAGGTSSLTNLGFESGDVNWLKGAGWTITTASPLDTGTWSAKYSGIGQSNIAHETMAPVSPGTTITASCRISKGNNRDDFAGGAVVLQWFDKDFAPVGFAVGNVVNVGTAAFQTSTVTGTAPEGAAFVRLAASGTRDVKGRATDVVTVDSFTWNHTFTLGGSGGSGGSASPISGPITFSFRVRDAKGCEAVATRTIGSLTSGNFTYLVSETPGSVSSFNVPLPPETTVGEAIVLLSITPVASPGISGYWNPTGGIALSAGQGQLSVGTVQHCVFVATASHIASGVPCEVASNMGSPSRTGKFLAVRIPSAYVKTPLEFADGGANLFNGPFQVYFGWAGPSIAIGTFFNENGTTNTSYPLPLVNTSISFNGINYAVCMGFYTGSSPLTVGSWNVSPPGGFTLTQPSILRGI
jgi:hypothetical protein